jgi:release factor glutamine methyltransferase
MKIEAWLKESVRRLAAAGIGTARLDSLVLLEDVTGRDRSWLLAHPEHELSPAMQTKLTKLLNARAQHTPLAYVRGHTEFYGHNFVITPAVLEPRPESETMIDLLLQLEAEGAFGSQSSQKTLRIADVGAGSGALGITAERVLEPLRKVSVDLLEIDPAACKVAITNVEKHTTSISVIESDLLQASSQDYDVLLCNLPYVPDSYQINEAASMEPRLAIFGGPDGLDVYRKLFDQATIAKKQPLYILTESLPPQHSALQQLAKQYGYRLDRAEDFIQVFAANP